MLVKYCISSESFFFLVIEDEKQSSELKEIIDTMVSKVPVYIDCYCLYVSASATRNSRLTVRN